MKTIRVTGLIYIDDDEYDPGPLGPLTASADQYYRLHELNGLDDIECELVEDDD